MSRSVRTTISIDAAPQLVLDAFLLQEHLHGWWGVDRSLVQAKVGGLYVLTWGVSAAGFQYVSSGVIEAFEPGRQLSIRDLVYFNPERPLLGPMTLRVSFRPQSASTIIEVTQDGYGDGPDWDWYYEAVRGAWPVALGGLKEYLEKMGSPLSRRL